MRMGNKKMKERIAHLLEEAKAQEHVPAEFVAAADKWVANMNDSEGQIAGFEMNLAPEEKGELNFITDRELGYVGKRKKNVHTTQYFIDEVMLHDLETNLTTELKLVRKWIHGFVEKVLAKYDLAELNRGKGLLGIERIPELQEPLDIAYNDYGLWINSQYLTL